MAKARDPSVVERFEGLPIIIVFVLLLALFMYTAPQVFLQPFIYTTFLSTLPPLLLLAVGLTFVIGAGEIDLSFPAIISFSGFVFAILFKEYELGWLAVVAALASGIVVGFINGIIIARIGIPSFIATLGTQFFWFGMATVLSGGKSYALRGAEESSVWQVIVGRRTGMHFRRESIGASVQQVHVLGINHELVIGLGIGRLAGGIRFVSGGIRQRWCADDLLAIEINRHTIVITQANDQLN